MISIILPTYNEAGNIANLINQISLILKKGNMKLLWLMIILRIKPGK